MKDDMSDIVFRGALARFFVHNRERDNPYPDTPGCLVKHKAWLKGYDHPEPVLREHWGQEPCLPPLK
jgi:hypothetical protein